ncbi:MAG: ATP-dependent acyl-CoA ligase [Betaproteobacteria bacterium]|nr:ATP-dependent acyl-CoA ligase [Betaproteobacteria bacterium]
MSAASPRARMSNWGTSYRDMTIGAMLAERARRYGDREFLHFLHDGRRYSWVQLDRLSNRVANGLAAEGVARGDHVAVIMDNCPEQLLIYFALGKLGAVAVPIIPSARGRLLHYFLDHSDSTWVVAEAGRMQETLAVAPDRIRAAFLVPDDTGDSLAVDPRLKAFVHLTEADDAPIAVDVQFTDIAMLTYTSGTTGPSKANMYTHATLVQMGMSTAETYGYRFDDVLYVALPLNHVNAYACTTWGCIVAGASIAVSRKFSVSRYWEEIRRSGATGTHLLSSMINFLWHRPEHALDADNRLRFTVLTPMPSYALQWERRFGVRAIMSYGLSDYTMATAFTMLDPVSKLGSAGRPRPGIELRIVDENDLDLPPGTHGEIVLRNNNPWATSLGYYKNPQATAAAQRNLWWHTGDHGYLDEDGYLFFMERKKEAIRRRGENISTFEVEAVLLDHPDVAEAAVFGLPDENGDEEVTAVVMRVDDSRLSESDLSAHCTANLAGFMVPRYVRFVTEMPHTDTHKIQKSVLRQQTIDCRDTLWDREKSGDRKA